MFAILFSKKKYVCYFQPYTLSPIRSFSIFCAIRFVRQRKRHLEEKTTEEQIR